MTLLIIALAVAWAACIGFAVALCRIAADTDAKLDELRRRLGA